MTREEAIGIMKVIIHMLEEKYDTDRVEDAVDLAIEALSAEPCEDAISRQAALDAFNLSEKTRKYGGDHSGYDTMMLYEIQDVIEDLPSVTPKQRWIPVSERLPEDSYAVLVWCPERRNIYCANREKDQWCICGTYHIVSEDVDAWMPLPEPYRAESEVSE